MTNIYDKYLIKILWQIICYYKILNLLLAIWIIVKLLREVWILTTCQCINTIWRLRLMVTNVVDKQVWVKYCGLRNYFSV